LQNISVARSKGALIQEALGVEEYGAIISLRPSFGFIQYIHSDEQVYFSEHDVYEGVKIGDIVSFTAHQSPKGLAASRIKHIDDSVDLESLSTKVLGTISRIPERHRSNCGLLEVELSSLPNDLHPLLRRKPVNTIAYRPKDLNSSQMPRTTLLERGDFVEFTLSRIPGCGLLLGTDIHLKKLKREREREKSLAQQMQRMLDAGAVREVGVVTAIKNKEYGFIKSQDRKDELYFRMDGFLGDEDTVIREGTEVEFFVVAEMVRGRLSDRAMHLQVIPQGSVQFEVVVARDALVTVVTEPGMQAEETPGVGVLPTPISVAEITKKPNDVINDVEVWQRCMPDEMLCKRGDVLKVNVHYYRPEKLFFIRAVRLIEPFLLGRDKGTICSIKESAGFGFITSDSRKIDLYFRLNQVLAASGEMLKRGDVVEGLRVSFDVTVESEKLRAIRVKELSSTDNGTKGDAEAAPTRIPIKSDVYGKVVRNTTAKKESVGLIQVSPAIWREIQSFEYVDPDLMKSLSSFMSKMFLQEHSIIAISSGMRRQLCALMDKEFLELAYETVDGETIEGVVQKNLRITKLYGGKRTAPPNQATQKSHRDSVSKDGYTLSFTREDYLSEQQLGPLGNDLEVIFDIVWDVVKGKRVAHSVRLTDEPVAGAETEQVGIVDVFIEKSDKFGFIRVVPTWEKLFWHISSVDNGASSLKQGSFVSFMLRRRGGMRCAAHIKAITDDSSPLYQRIALEECLASTEEQPILAAVVERDRAILLDVSLIASLKDKLLPLSKMTTILADADAQAKTWEKGVKVAGGNNKEQVVEVDAATTGSPNAAGASPVIAGPSSESGTISSERNRVEYAAKYFSYVERDPVLITNPPPSEVAVSTSEEGTVSEEAASSSPPLYKIGDIVEVNVTVNWTRAQPIVSVAVQKVVGQVLGGLTNRRGTLTKTKHRFKNMPHLSDFYHLNNVDFVEITELEEIPISEKDSATAAAAPPPNASTTGNVVPTKQKINYYFGVQSEIRTQPSPPAAGNNNNNNSSNNSNSTSTNTDALAVGDEVEFCVASAFPNMALYVRVIPRVAKDYDLSFQSSRQGINREMKTKVGTANSVSMAAGPPSDSAKGFEPGWRHIDLEQVESLPWSSSLLGHLLSTAKSTKSPVVPATTNTVTATAAAAATPTAPVASPAATPTAPVASPAVTPTAPAASPSTPTPSITTTTTTTTVGNDAPAAVPDVDVPLPADS
jgi:cold shock CspA family protein